MIHTDLISIFIPLLVLCMLTDRPRGIKNKHLKAGVVKNKNIHFRCLAFSVEILKET